MAHIHRAMKFECDISKSQTCFILTFGYFTVSV